MVSFSVTTRLLGVTPGAEVARVGWVVSPTQKE